MTAINVLCSERLSSAFIACDAAVYRPDGITSGFGNKLFSVPHWPGVIGCRGTAVTAPMIGTDLAERFATFDEMVAGIEGALPECVKAWDFVIREAGLDGGLRSELLIAGFSAKREAPEAYVINTSDALPVCTTKEEFEAAGMPGPFELVRLPDDVMAPAVKDLQLIIAADWQGTDDQDAASVEWSMRKMIEMQRQAEYGDGICWIGGFAQIAAISATGITQKILCRWPEDRVGERLKPLPIDWAEWHRDNPKHIAPTTAPVGLSRLKHQMLERKAAKRGLCVISADHPSR